MEVNFECWRCWILFDSHTQVLHFCFLLFLTFCLVSFFFFILFSSLFHHSTLHTRLHVSLCAKPWHNSLSCATLWVELTACLLNSCIVMYHKCLVQCLYKWLMHLAGVFDAGVSLHSLVYLTVLLRTPQCFTFVTSHVTSFAVQALDLGPLDRRMPILAYVK